MRSSSMIGVMMFCLAFGVSSASARMVAQPIVVGPPPLQFGSQCPARITVLGGTSAGIAVPVRALALGSPIDRSTDSFATGGSGTANSREAIRRREAGLQYEPRIFDPAAPARAFVFASSTSPENRASVYQRLPLKTDGRAYSRNAMIFAKATSPTLGRIISLAMILPHKPAARAKLTISWTGECPYKATLYIYAPAMSVERLRRLSAQSDCNWGNPATCSRAERPRGRVLFVQQQRSGVGYEHRWVDYDMLLPG